MYAFGGIKSRGSRKRSFGSDDGEVAFSITAFACLISSARSDDNGDDNGDAD